MKFSVGAFAAILIFCASSFAQDSTKASAPAAPVPAVTTAQDIAPAPVAPAPQAVVQAVAPVPATTPAPATQVTAAPAPAVPAVVSPSVKSSDDDLLIDDSGAEALTKSSSKVNTGTAKTPDAAVAKQVDSAASATNQTASPTSSTTPSGAADAGGAAGRHKQTGTPTSTSTRNASAPLTTIGANAAPKQASSDTAKLNSATIEDAGAMNFAQGDKKYRSPRRAMLMSLLLPGLGQAYVHSAPRAIGYMVVEAGLIAASVVFKVKSNDEFKAAKTFSDKHFSDAKLKNFSDSLTAYARVNHSGMPASQVDSLMQCEIFGYPDTADGFNFTHAVEGNLSSSSTSRLNFIDYSMTGKSYQNQNISSRGWDDCVPDFSAATGFDTMGVYKGAFNSDTLLTGDAFNDSLHILLWQFASTKKGAAVIATDLLGTSAHQSQYHDMLKKSSALGKDSRVFIFILLANHVISAVDAMISARVYNDKLIAKKSSVLSHIKLDSDFALSPTSGPKSTIAMQVSF